MLFGIFLIVALILVSVGEWYAYSGGLLWHKEKRDPRNFPPPR